MSSVAYFLARDTIDHFNTVVKPIVFLSTFYFFNNPRSILQDNYLVLLALVYCVTGIGYTLAIWFELGLAQLVSSQLSKKLPFYGKSKLQEVIQLDELCSCSVLHCYLWYWFWWALTQNFQNLLDSSAIPSGHQKLSLLLEQKSQQFLPQCCQYFPFPSSANRQSMNSKRRVLVI